MLNDVLEVNEQTIQIDHEGFLLEPSDWNEDVAQVLAKKEGIELSEEVWEVVMFVRDHFETTNAFQSTVGYCRLYVRNTVKRKRHEDMSTICSRMAMGNKRARLLVCVYR